MRAFGEERPCSQLTWTLEPIISAPIGVGVQANGRERALKTQGTGLVICEGVRTFGLALRISLRCVASSSTLLVYSPLERWQLLGTG